MTTSQGHTEPWQMRGPSFEAQAWSLEDDVEGNDQEVWTQIYGWTKRVVPAAWVNTCKVRDIATL